MIFCKLKYKLLLATILFCIIAISACEKSDNTYDKQLNRIDQKAKSNPYDYFPLSVGNNWTYKRTVGTDRSPLYSFVFTIEDDPSWPGLPSKGTSIVSSGKESALKSGSQYFEVLYEDKGGFEIAVEGSPYTAHGLDPFKLNRLDSLIWRVKERSNNNCRFLIG